jgi:hypothetical protein
MRDSVKNKAPVQLTGGAGFRYENAVAARFLLDLLAGTNPLGVDFGRITRIDWQARDSGWLADDLVITCNASGLGRTAALSIKSSRQVSGAGFPADFVTIAWAQWFGVKTDRKLRDSSSAAVLITGSLAHEVKDAWSNLLNDALLTTPDRMAARLSPAPTGEGSQSSAVQRALFESFRCPKELRENGDAGDATVVDLMRHVRLLHFDFDAAPSRDHATALADCQRLLKSGDAAEAERLWEPAHWHRRCKANWRNDRPFGHTRGASWRIRPPRTSRLSAGCGSVGSPESGPYGGHPHGNRRVSAAAPHRRPREDPGLP